MALQATLNMLNNTAWRGTGEVGTTISMLFDVGRNDEGWYRGDITNYDVIDKQYTIVFEDGEIIRSTGKELMDDVHARVLMILARV